MSYTNETLNYHLPQWVGSDKPTWLVDLNGAFAAIDTGLAAVQTQSDATDLVVSGHTSAITALQGTTSDQGTAITGLRTDVDHNTGDISTINSLIGNGTPTTTDKTIIGAINELHDDITDMASVRTIFIGDSYAINNGGWIDEVDATGLIDSDDVIKLAGGGIGFKDGGFLSLLQNATISDPETIKRIVVCGGANDHTGTLSDLQTAIGAFATYARTTYPNAELCVGHIGWTTNADLRRKYTTITIPAYKAGARKFGLRYLYGVEYSLHYYGYLDDGIHPTSYGCRELATYIMQAVVAGCVSIDWLDEGATTKFTTTAGNWLWYTTVIDDEVEFITNDLSLTYTSETFTANTDVTIGTLSTTNFILGYPNNIRNGFLTEALINGTDLVPCFVGLTQSGTGDTEVKIRFYSTLTSVDSLRLYNMTGKMKLLYC